MEGKPCYANDPFIIRHVKTSRLLASDLVKYTNDYGLEYEMCCNNFLTNNKYHTLLAEKTGKMKIDTIAKVELDQNIWAFVDSI